MEWGVKHDVFLPVASMKVPPKRKGNAAANREANKANRLNESPSEKEGKCSGLSTQGCCYRPASMKVPPKRKGNLGLVSLCSGDGFSLNESPSEKEGKCRIENTITHHTGPQ